MVLEIEYDIDSIDTIDTIICKPIVSYNEVTIIIAALESAIRYESERLIQWKKENLETDAENFEDNLQELIEAHERSTDFLENVHREDSLISEDYIEDYLKHLSQDIFDFSTLPEWLHIDWMDTIDNLLEDYTQNNEGWYFRKN